MIDVNVSLGRWPFRRLPDDEPEALVRRLKRLGVTEAWAGSFDAMLHHDLDAVNARLAETCQATGPGLLIPFGAINPSLPGWRDDLRRCVSKHRMPGIRLHPNYHGYALDHPAVSDLLAECARQGLIVQVALKMQDERTIHPLLKGLPTTDPKPLLRLLEREPRPPVVLLNAMMDLKGELRKQLLGVPGLYVDIAMLEGTGGLERLIEELGTDRLLFGSFAPYFVAESAHLKLKESAVDPTQKDILCERNARRLVPRR
jgi:predicted TIM-barrel fold metal-dependent hydrolase